MDPIVEIGLLLITGVITGIAGGLFGIGGGTIIVPILMFLIGYDQLQAQGTSLAAMLLPVGIFGVLKYRKAGIFNLKCSLLLGLGLLLGAWPGAIMANHMDKNLLKLIYSLFLFYVSVKFIEPIYLVKKSVQLSVNFLISKGYLQENFKFKSEGDGVLPGEKLNSSLKKPYAPIENWYWLLLLGLMGGVASGLFGIGGGAIIVPFLALFFHFDHQEARVISLGALLPPVGFFGMLPYYQEGHVKIISATPVAIGIMAGAFFGAMIGISVPKKLVKRLYGFFLIGIAINYMVQSTILIINTRF